MHSPRPLLRSLAYGVLLLSLQSASAENIIINPDGKAVTVTLSGPGALRARVPQEAGRAMPATVPGSTPGGNIIFGGPATPTVPGRTTVTTVTTTVPGQATLIRTLGSPVQAQPTRGSKQAAPAGSGVRSASPRSPAGTAIGTLIAVRDLRGALITEPLGQGRFRLHRPHAALSLTLNLTSLVAKVGRNGTHAALPERAQLQAGRLLVPYRALVLLGCDALPAGGNVNVLCGDTTYPLVLRAGRN